MFAFLGPGGATSRRRGSEKEEAVEVLWWFMRISLQPSPYLCVCLSNLPQHLAAAHISSGTTNTKGDIPPISKSVLEDRLENIPFPLCSQLSDSVLKSKPSQSAGILTKSYQLIVH